MADEVRLSIWESLALFAKGGARSGPPKGGAGKLSGGHWATINGRHVYIGADGTLLAGGGGMKGGFKPGNTYGAARHRNPELVAAKSAHTSASRVARSHVKAGTVLTKEGRKSLKDAATAHEKLRDVRAKHKEAKRLSRNDAARKKRAEAKESRARSSPPEKPPEKHPEKPPEKHPEPSRPSHVAESPRPPWQPRPKESFERPHPHELANAQGEWAGSLSPEHRAAIADYSHGGYMEANEISRNPGFINKYPSFMKTREAGVAKVRRLEDAMAGAHAPSDMVVHRGIEKDSLRAAGIDLDQLRAGSVVEMHGFKSTSLRRDVAEGFSKGGVTLTIRVPKGTPGGYINAVRGGSQHAEEQEFLMPPSASRFRFVKAGRRPDGEIEVILEADHGH